MQTLGLSDSMPRTEGRIKSLLWPSIQNGNDVDYLGAQGYWVCALVAVGSFVLSIMSGHPFVGVFVLLFYYLGGVGVREHSRYAAVVVLVLYLADSFFSVPGPARVMIGGVLLSNLRATWIASSWKPESNEAIAIPRFGDTWSDKFVDEFPMWLWPKVRISYYVLSVSLLAMTSLGLVMLYRRHA
jgi:hypothetical protein